MITKSENNSLTSFIELCNFYEILKDCGIIDDNGHELLVKELCDETYG